MSGFRCLSVGLLKARATERKTMKTDYKSWIWNGTGEKQAYLNWNFFFLLGWLLQSVENTRSKVEYTQMTEMF